MARKYSHYVVFRGKVPGIYVTWLSCKNQVNGFKGNAYKGYHNQEEAQQAWKAFNDR